MSALAPGPPRTRLELVGRAAFVLLPVAIAVRLLFAGDLQRHNVYLKVFARAATAFAERGDLYLEADGFRYPPLAAALLLPFAWCGPLWGSILWRLVNWSVLALGVRAVHRAGFPFAAGSRERGVLLLLLALASAGSLNNGQPNVLILGLSLLATAAFLHRHNAAPALAVTGSTVFKVYPLAYGLVLATLRPRLLPWLLVAVAAAALLPFALREPAWVQQQYTALFELLRHEDRTMDPADSYRDLRLLVRSCGLLLTDGAFHALQVLGGGAIALLCFVLRRRGAPPLRALDYAFSLTSLWYMLLGPATEKVTYVLAAPVLGWPLLAAWRAPAAGSRAARCYWTTVVALFVLDHLVPAVPRSLQAAQPWLRCALPLAALLGTIGLLRRAAIDLRRGAMETRGAGG
jgi:hypothetical protein